MSKLEKQAGRVSEMALNERAISIKLERYFRSRGLEPIGEFNVFDHIDDSLERSFIVDFTVGPVATKGNRASEDREMDRMVFNRNGPELDRVVDDLLEISEFPTNTDCENSWHMQFNPNPMVGIAVEIENANDKYFLGSLLAASCAGRWGLLVVPSTPKTTRWVKTIRRMIHKGSCSPIPSNILILKWSRLEPFLNL